jgi:hypothetical protein
MPFVNMLLTQGGFFGILFFHPKSGWIRRRGIMKTFFQLNVVGLSVQEFLPVFAELTCTPTIIEVAVYGMHDHDVVGVGKMVGICVILSVEDHLTMAELLSALRKVFPTAGFTKFMVIKFPAIFSAQAAVTSA